jgi:hypothetical protein
VRTPGFHRGVIPRAGEVWPGDDPSLREVAGVHGGRLTERMLGRYEYGRPDQIAAWRSGAPSAAGLAENSAGR